MKIFFLKDWGNVKILKVNRSPDGLVSDIDAEHVERAMREIDDARDAEDQRQPGRHHEQRGRAGQPVERLDREARQIHLDAGCDVSAVAVD